MSALFLLSATGHLGTAPFEVGRMASVRIDGTEQVRVRWTLEEILGALRIVESGDTGGEGRDAVGDGGAAIGPFQIHRAYWEDAQVPGTYEDCRDPLYASNVVVAYWRRYCPRALDFLDAEVLARVHNGGPEGHRWSRTRPFWRKVERELVKRQSRISSGPASPLLGRDR